ncbi:hypothetical protein QFW77_05850 [Luteimonas sp. RD2P54]|uniref:Nucleotidyltransferase n=1 Tax=Luteimonas endophytica TaxID=3042023 RepID=A0ABT6J6Q7_9GAMM|nr:hypothetical protein [Luteimonas endophytica]MDH5822513.1 hypothetical protein [Luteimonas endophytica]
MNRTLELDAATLLSRVAERVPPTLRANVVVIGSIATAWAFRDVSGTHSVATKDIDLLLRPAIDAVATAETLGQELLDDGWQPRFPNGIERGAADTPDDRLPALRLSPPGDGDDWFVELLAESSGDQATRKHWRRVETGIGLFGLPSFRYMRVAVHGAEETEFGLRVARPARMALAHLLEHADPDTTPISNLPGTPPRFTKDVGRAISLWWLAREQSPLAGKHWLAEWRETLASLYPDSATGMKAAARNGLDSVANYLREAHAIALNGVLAPHGTTLDAYRRAHASLFELIDFLGE